MNFDEEYIHFQESITSLNRAWRTLCDLEKFVPGNAIWSAAYRMTIVEYCKPFTKSQINSNEKYALPLPIIPEEFQQLHEKLLTLRYKVMAHSDLSVLDAKVSYDKNASFPIPLIVQNFLTDFPDVSEIRRLVEAVLDVLNKKLTEYELKFKERP